MSMLSMAVEHSGPGSLDRFQWQRGAVLWADTIGPLGRTALRKAAPVGKGPNAGRFARALRYERGTVSGTSVQVKFTANTPYAIYVIAPTQPHVITAKAARFLRWTDSGGGARFARTVNHPGTKGNPFHLQVMRQLTPVAQAEYTRIMRETFGGV